MKMPYNLRAPEGDGASAGGGGQPAQPTQPSTPPAEGPSSVKDIWGNREAPDWIKNIGLGTIHDKTRVAGPAQEPQTPPTAPAEPPAATPVAEPPAQPAVVPPAATTPPQQPPAVPPAAPLTAETLAAALARVIPQQPQQPQPRQEMTEEELRQQLGIFNATVEDYEAAFGVKPENPARLAAYNRHLQAVARQAVTIANVLIQRTVADQQAAVQPYIQAVRAQEAQNQRATFFQENQDLLGYDAIVEKEFIQAKSSGRQFASATEARKFIADQTRATLKSIGITPAARGNGTQPSQPTTRPQTSSRQMTTTSVGGRSGGSATPGKATNTMEAVWGKR